MIIKFPTGFYETVIPQNPQDGGNVTFVISNTEPPRANLTFPKIPLGIVDRKKQPKTIGLLDRRDTVDDLVFTISQSSRTEEGNNNRQFETGQVLEFSDSPIKLIDPMLVGNTTQTQHDVNRLNYDALGVDAEEQQLIADSSLVVYRDLSDQLNTVRQRRRDSESLVTSNQKVINDTDRALKGLVIIQNSSPTTDSDVDDLIIKLGLRRSEAFEARDEATEVANTAAAEASVLVDEIRTVGTILT
jgi:hypothetical protein